MITETQALVGTLVVLTVSIAASWLFYAVKDRLATRRAEEQEAERILNAIRVANAEDDAREVAEKQAIAARRVKQDRVLAKLLVEMKRENARPFPVGPFTSRWSRLWQTYYAIVATM